MPQYLAIVAYRSLVAGVPTKKLDFQVRWFNEENEAVVRQLIGDDPIHTYENANGETVSWELAEVFEVETFDPQRSGDEVIGFIASTRALRNLA
jgi:hypothetical protein